MEAESPQHHRVVSSPKSLFSSNSTYSSPLEAGPQNNYAEPYSPIRRPNLNSTILSTQIWSTPSLLSLTTSPAQAQCLLSKVPDAIDTFLRGN